jgi:hypothetical protein
MSSGADLSGVSLLGAVWHDYVIWVLGVDLRGGGVLRDPEVRLAGADLSDASLIGAHLIARSPVACGITLTERMRGRFRSEVGTLPRGWPRHGALDHMHANAHSGSALLLQVVP